MKILNWLKKNIKWIIALIISALSFISLLIIKSGIQFKKENKLEKEKNQIIEKDDEVIKETEQKIKSKKEGIKKDEKIVNDFANDLNNLARGKISRTNKSS